MPCSTKDPGKTVKQICAVGCISCKMCVKSCPAEAVSMEEGVVRIDHRKCLEYGPECEEICIEKCPRDIFRPFRTEAGSGEEKSAAAA